MLKEINLKEIDGVKPFDEDPFSKTERLLHKLRIMGTKDPELFNMAKNAFPSLNMCTKQVISDLSELGCPPQVIRTALTQIRVEFTHPNGLIVLE